MELNQELLEKCEEFFNEIVNEEENVKIDVAMDALRIFLERDVDGWTHHTPDKLAYAVQCRLEEIWILVKTEEKDSDLSVYFEDLMTELEDVSGYESDEKEYAPEASKRNRDDDEMLDEEEL